MINEVGVDGRSTVCRINSLDLPLIVISNKLVVVLLIFRSFCLTGAKERGRYSSAAFPSVPLIVHVPRLACNNVEGEEKQHERHPRRCI